MQLLYSGKPSDLAPHWILPIHLSSFCRILKKEERIHIHYKMNSCAARLYSLIYLPSFDSLVKICEKNQDVPAGIPKKNSNLLITAGEKNKQEYTSGELLALIPEFQ